MYTLRTFVRRLKIQELRYFKGATDIMDYHIIEIQNDVQMKYLLLVAHVSTFVNC